VRVIGSILPIYYTTKIWYDFEMPYADPKKNAEYKALWHQRNKDIRRIRIKSRRSSKRQFLKDTKELNSTCPGCKVTYPWYTLDFDHLPQYKKSFNLSSSGLRDKTIEEIKSEMSKCQIICSNCHRYVTEMRTKEGKKFEHYFGFSKHKIKMPFNP
jgi:hypothetical protein